MQVLESELATSHQQSTCIHTDLKSEAAHVMAQLMATRQQLDRVEKAQKALAQQQQTRIQVRAIHLDSPQASGDPGISPCPSTFKAQFQHCFQDAYMSSCQLPKLASLKTIKPQLQHSAPSATNASDDFLNIIAALPVWHLVQLHVWQTALYPQEWHEVARLDWRTGEGPLLPHLYVYICKSLVLLSGGQHAIHCNDRLARCLSVCLSPFALTCRSWSVPSQPPSRKPPAFTVVWRVK